MLFNHNTWGLAVIEWYTFFFILNNAIEPDFNYHAPRVRNITFIGAILGYIKEIKNLGSITSFRIIFNWYVAKKPCAEMWLLKQSFQIIHRASFWEGNLTYHTFLWVKLQKIKIPFYRVVGTMYPLLSRLIYWLPDYVVDQNLHVSSLWLCHMV